MLKLLWTPVAAAAPGSSEYDNAADELRVETEASPPVQTFPRTLTTLASPSPELVRSIDQWRSDKRRVVLMVHGYQFDPSGIVGGIHDDPFSLVYGVPGPDVDYHNSWLPIVGECDDSGLRGQQQLAELAIAFAWVSEGNLTDYGDACWDNGYQYAALDLAPLAARTLATVIAYLCQSGVTVDILAHSLGTRATSQAIGLLKPGVEDKTIGKVVLLGGAEFCVDAAASMAGRKFETFNICSREDGVLAWGADQGCHPVRFIRTDEARVIGRDGLIPNYKWLDVQLDRENAVAWLAGKGYGVSAYHENDIHPAAWLDHWAYYMNEGNRIFLRDLLAKSEITIAWFTGSGFPGGVDTPHYGHFSPAIPPTPETCAERHNALHPPNVD